MPSDDPALFYTGLVAEAYRPLRSSVPDPAPYERFVRRHGEPALELGCGDGDPLLDLRAAGLDVVGLDSSGDMLARCRAEAERRGVAVELVQQTMQAMDLGGRRFRSIYLAGPTFQLLVEPDAAFRALTAIGRHLHPEGRALVPLFVPDAVPAEEIGRWRTHDAGGGVTLRVAVVHAERLEEERRQHLLLRYEKDVEGRTEHLEQRWSLRWYAPGEFRALALETGLVVDQVFAPDGAPGRPDDDAGAFVLRHP